MREQVMVPARLGMPVKNLKQVLVDMPRVVARFRHPRPSHNLVSSRLFVGSLFAKSGEESVTLFFCLATIARAHLEVQKDRLV